MTNDKSIVPLDWQIPLEIRSRLGTSVGRQRSMQADGHLLLVTHSPPRPEDHVRAFRLFWRAPDGTWKSTEPGNGMNSLENLLGEYEDRIAALDSYEQDAKTADAYFNVLEELTPIHRATRNLYQVLQDARKMCPEYLDLIDLRNRAYAIDRTAELLLSGTQNALDVTVAKRAEEQARTSHQMATAAHRLNILAAFFFPIITVTAIVGIDLARVGSTLGFEVADRFLPFVFAGVILVGFVAGAILTHFINRRPSSTP